jgi:hypothetical protein
MDTMTKIILLAVWDHDVFKFVTEEQLDRKTTWSLKERIESDDEDVGLTLSAQMWEEL